jgi:uncharacterized protein YdhG (YjbR/CyaY superfamily)
LANPEDVDAYIAASDKEARPNLEELRELIKSTIPTVEERISWGVPFYRYQGDLAGFAAYKNHVSFGIGAGALQSKEREMLEEKGYVTGKRTIQIKFEQKVPASAIKKILKARARQNETKRVGR